MAAASICGKTPLGLFRPPALMKGHTVTEKFDRVWHDPVWSKVIAGMILAALAATAGTFENRRYTFLEVAVPLWLVIVTATGTFVFSTLLLSKILRAAYGFAPQPKFIGVDVPDPNPDQKLTFPVKCYFTFRNDSHGCIDVAVSDFQPEAVVTKNIAVAVLQVQMNQNWLPWDHGMDRVAVLPGKLFRGWVPADDSRFTAAQVRNLRGKLGTLTLTVNGKQLNFKL